MIPKVEATTGLGVVEIKGAVSPDTNASDVYIGLGGSVAIGNEEVSCTIGDVVASIDTTSPDIAPSDLSAAVDYDILATVTHGILLEIFFTFGSFLLLVMRVAGVDLLVWALVFLRLTIVSIDENSTCIFLNTFPLTTNLDIC